MESFHLFTLFGQERQHIEAFLFTNQTKEEFGMNFNKTMKLALIVSLVNLSGCAGVTFYSDSTLEKKNRNSDLRAKALLIG
jgi:hypothetical protein